MYFVFVFVAQNRNIVQSDLVQSYDIARLRQLENSSLQ